MWGLGFKVGSLGSCRDNGFRVYMMWIWFQVARTDESMNPNMRPLKQLMSNRAEAEIGSMRRVYGLTCLLPF